jgi:hypothetical protein
LTLATQLDTNTLSAPKIFDHPGGGRVSSGKPSTP